MAPAVLGEQDAPLVFVAAKFSDPESKQVTVELRRTTEGELALVTYSTLERLVQGCGERQHWIGVPAEALAVLAEQAGAEIVLQDVPLPEEERRSREATS